MADLTPERIEEQARRVLARALAHMTPGLDTPAWHRELGLIVADLCTVVEQLLALLSESSEREKALMRKCLEAEKFDAQYENSRLPGDSALSALFLSFEEYLAGSPSEKPGSEEEA